MRRKLGLLAALVAAFVALGACASHAVVVHHHYYPHRHVVVHHVVVHHVVHHIHH